MPSLSTLKARAQGIDTTLVDPVIEAAKALTRIDKTRCTGVETRTELVKRSAKRVVKDGPKVNRSTFSPSLPHPLSRPRSRCPSRRVCACAGGGEKGGREAVHRVHLFGDR